MVVAVAAAMARRLPPRAGAVTLDRHHRLHGRLTNALAFEAANERSPLMEVAIDDACEHAERLDPRHAAPLQVPRNLLGSMAVAAGVAAIALLHVPARPPPEAPHQKQINAVQLSPDDVELFRDAARELGRRDQSPEVKAAVEKFNQLIEDLAHKRLDRTEAFRRMEQIERELMSGAEADAKSFDEALKQTSEDLKKSDLARPLSDSLEKKDLEQAKKDLKNLASSLRDDKSGKKKVDKAALDKLRQAMERAAAKRKEALAAVNEKRNEVREQLLSKKNQKKDQLDGGAPNPEEERQLKKKERELERLDREAERQERAQRQLDRLDRDLAKAAEDLLHDLGMSAEDLEQAAEDINRMQDEQMSEKEKEELRQRLQELREMLRQEGQGGKERMKRMLKFGKRARGGQGGKGQGGKGQQGDDGDDGEQEGKDGKDGQGKDGQGDGQGGMKLGPGGTVLKLGPGLRPGPGSRSGRLGRTGRRQGRPGARLPRRRARQGHRHQPRLQRDGQAHRHEDRHRRHRGDGRGHQAGPQQQPGDPRRGGARLQGLGLQEGLHRLSHAGRGADRQGSRSPTATASTCTATSSSSDLGSRAGRPRVQGLPRKGKQRESWRTRPKRPRAAR